MSRPPILALKDARLQDGPLMLFDGADLALEPRARACLVGRNGAGKSTLLRILAGEAELDSGERFAQPSARIVRVAQEPLRPTRQARALGSSARSAPSNSIKGPSCSRASFRARIGGRLIGPSP